MKEDPMKQSNLLKTPPGLFHIRKITRAPSGSRSGISPHLRWYGESDAFLLKEGKLMVPEKCHSAYPADSKTYSEQI